MIHKTKKAVHAGLKLGKKHAKRHWERYGLYGIGGLLIILMVVVQLVYPWQSLPLYATIDGVNVSGQSADKAMQTLNDKYENLPIALYFGNNPKAYRKPIPKDIGLTISSKPQVDAKTYNFWLRLVPTSLFWAHIVTPSVAPSYKHDAKQAGVYVQKQLGESCNVTPKNASLTYKDKKLQVVPALDGGTCKLANVEKLLNTVKPLFANHKLKIPMIERPAAIHDNVAKSMADRLMAQTKDVKIKAGDSEIAVPQDTVLAWLDFTAPDTGIVVAVNAERSAEFFAKQVAPKVSVKAGTSHITTLDFTVINQSTGGTGQTLDTPALIELLNKWLSGEDATLTAPVKAVAPTPVYTRTYTKTDTGLAALLTQFAQAHSGTFGISYAELYGQHRHAGYNDTRIFETASTYKLFVAYGTLKRIDEGKWHWSDQIHGGRNLSKCFDDMIVKSDNECAKALLTKIGYATLTNELRAMGLKRSSFLGSYIQSTAADESAFLGMLQTGTLPGLSQSSTNTLISAMKRNIYRQGIPKGASGQVADKVGFLYALLHDASIVYSPTGTYVLVILTDGSSWGTIAELTRQIEQWRAS